MIALAVLLAFFVGSIPFGYVIGRLFYHTDIRSHGSGNIGAMNALRTLGKAGAAAVLLLDATKGFLPVFVVLHADRDRTAAALVAAATVLGHCFSPWLGWKGGKGVATSLGAIFALSWPAALVGVALWMLGAAATTYSSVGSMLAGSVAPVALWYFTRSAAATGYGVFAAILIIYAHRENLVRLREGRENPIRRKQ